MTIDVKPEQQRLIDLAVRSGAYQNPGEVLEQAFEIIREQLDSEGWLLEQRERWQPISRGDLLRRSAVN